MIACFNVGFVEFGSVINHRVAQSEAQSYTELVGQAYFLDDKYIYGLFKPTIIHALKVRHIIARR
jgi:hypothetical protein